MNDDAIGNIASQLGVGVGEWVKNLGVNAANACLGIASLDGRVGILSDADPAHGEEAGRSLGVSETKATLPKARC